MSRLYNLLEYSYLFYFFRVNIHIPLSDFNDFSLFCFFTVHLTKSLSVLFCFFKELFVLSKISWFFLFVLSILSPTPSLSLSPTPSLSASLLPFLSFPFLFSLPFLPAFPFLLSLFLQAGRNSRKYMFMGNDQPIVMRISVQERRGLCEPFC